ncbi:MAG: hypothetical protein J0H66_11605 [Solirubrobacterales bacterium]|nr:hypothetical protein [Solirubrobacterales bacterium]OJU94785.1 MAG: hypothetical protein BGO23_07990 [Solirubrobacterales bacterium 67-14]
MVAAVAWAIAGGSADDPTGPEANRSEQAEPPLENAPPKIAAYMPGPQEEIPRGKRLAAKVTQAALTYGRHTTRAEHIGSLRRFGGSLDKAELAYVHDPQSRSWAKIIYPQLSGYTGDTMGAMVVVRQTREGETGQRHSQTRVADIRLVLEGEEWRLSEIASLGGKPAPRPTSLSETERAVLDHPRIALPDSARWDIYRGTIEPNLLLALAQAADQAKIAVTVLVTGHPPNVWATDRPSAHASGYAADIYAVDGTTVIDQRQPGTPAYDLTQTFLTSGAAQVGSPWILSPGAPQSFTDDVHQDHLHLQQTGLP